MDRVCDSQCGSSYRSCVQQDCTLPCGLEIQPTKSRLQVDVPKRLARQPLRLSRSVDEGRGLVGFTDIIWNNVYSTNRIYVYIRKLHSFTTTVDCFCKR